MLGITEHWSSAPAGVGQACSCCAGKEERQPAEQCRHFKQAELLKHAFIKLDCATGGALGYQPELLLSWK